MSASIEQQSLTPASHEQFSKQQLADPNFPLSRHLGRPFANGTNFGSEKELDAALDAAKKVLPEAQSAYKPSGKTTTSAAVVLLGITPVLLLLLLLICGGLCVGWAWLEENEFAGGTSRDSRKIAGWLSIVLDIILVVLMVFLPARAYGIVSKILKNRDPKVPAILAGVITFLVGIVLFVPIWKGATLAPTDITFLFIPIRWVLIAAGALLGPLIAAAAVHGNISSQKFCEDTGYYLKKIAQVPLAFEFAENALVLLHKGEHESAVRLPRASDDARKSKHEAQITIWGHDQATSAFIEMTARFRGKSKPAKTMTMEKSQDKSSEWLAFSGAIDKSQAQQLRGYAGMGQG